MVREQFPRDDPPPHPGPGRASAVGDRTAISGTQRRTRTGSLRRAVIPRLAPARRPDRDRLHLAPAGTATRPRPRADAAAGTRRHPRDAHRTFFRDNARLLRTHAETQGNSTADLTQ